MMIMIAPNYLVRQNERAQGEVEEEAERELQKEEWRELQKEERNYERMLL